jgi:outer membrane lipoprotein-sorting protein
MSSKCGARTKAQHIFKRFAIAICLLIPVAAALPLQVHAQTQKATDATALFYALRNKLTSVKDYVADVRMKIDVAFMRVPLLAGKLYFKAPGKLKLERNGGISVMPRKSISLSVDKMMPTGNVTVIDAGREQIGDIPVRVIKVIPEGESDIILTKVWVDERRTLALRTETTTRDQGTVRMELSYGQYANLGLADRIVFIMDVKEYKLPKGVTMDYDEGTAAPKSNPAGALPKKGRIEIRYLSYKVNVGLSDAIFREKP